MTTAPPTNTGILTDKEGTGFPGIRIDDKPYTVLNYVQRYLDAIPKKAKIGYQITDGKISKIWEEKGEPSHPAANTESKPSQQPVNNQSSCTSPDTGLPKTIEGKISAINHQVRIFTFRPDGGFAVDISWGPAQDAAMSKFKEKYQAKVTYEPGAQNRLIEIISTKKWEDKKGGYGGQPRNEKMIVVQTMLKAYSELWTATNTPDSVTFADAREEIFAAIEADLPKLLKLGGGA